MEWSFRLTTASRWRMFLRIRWYLVPFSSAFHGSWYSLLTCSWELRGSLGNHGRKQCLERCNKPDPMMNASKCELTHIKLFLECFLKFLFPASLSSFVTFISVIKHIKLLSVRVCVINLWCKSVTQAMLAAIRSRGSLFLFSLLIFQHSFVRLRKFKCNFFFVLHCRGNFVFPL